MSDQVIKTTMENGIEVSFYTVNKDKDMHHLFAIDCSAIITEQSQLKALKIRKQYEKRP